jgi:hypothetical protein
MENLSVNAGWTGAPKKALTVEERDALLNKWLSAKNALEQAKDAEMQLRKQIVADIIQAKPGEKGTRNFELNAGYKLKAVLKLNYKLNNDEVDSTLDRIEKLGEEGKFIVDRIVKFKPELSVSEYNALNDRANTGDVMAKAFIKELNKILTIEDASPSLELVEPKAKK